MNRISLLVHLSAGATAALLLNPGAHAQQSDNGALEEVTVTAQKRSQNIQEVPLSVSALDTHALEALGAQNFEDIARTLPGIAFSNLGPGQNRFTIRGVSTFSGTSVVSIYLDDSPIASTINYTQPSLALFDLERVELLRGPQGTLYGEGSLGGTLRYITASPDTTKFSAKTETTLSQTESGGANYGINAAVNLPFADDNAAVRLVGLHRKDSGYIDNIPLREKDFNDVTTNAARAKTLWKAAQDLSIELSGLYQKIEQGGPNVESFDAPRGSLQNNDTAPQSYADRLAQGGLKLTYEVPWATLVSSTAYFTRKADQDVQSRGFAFDTPLYSIINYDFRVLTEEARLASKQQGPLQWLAGVYYNQYEVEFLERDFDRTPAGASFGANHRDNKFKQYAVFGEAEYALTPRLFGTVGLRWFKENQEAINNQGQTFSVDANEVIPRVALRYEFTPRAMIYTSATEGFRSGGVNLFAIPGVDNTYAPDKTWNYEVGTRVATADRRLTADLAVYHIDWRDLQTFVARPDLGPFVFFVQNAAAAKVDGAELQVNWRPTMLRGFGIGATGSYSNARYTKDAPFEGKAGNKLPKVPRWTASGYADYRFPLRTGWEGYGRFDYEYYGTFPELGNNIVKSGNYQLCNLRFGVESVRWQVEAFTENLWNTRADLFQRASTEFGVYRNRPRTYGLTLRWRY